MTRCASGAMPSPRCRRVHAGLGADALALLQSPQAPPLTTVLTLLINALAALPAPVALVLDDYHAITAPAIHQSLTFLLEHLPPQLRLVIISRVDPPLPLMRLRAHGELTELRAADLCFTTDEVATFFNQLLGLRLATDEVAALAARTEGWIAGLVLAAHALPRACECGRLHPRARRQPSLHPGLPGRRCAPAATRATSSASCWTPPSWIG